ncbi:hypothetical protein EDD37DRAFT_605257 [Exophiala viscosa]|uniref:uncharacterized protein n=1 Tax=Exophiala viscosa TaxID=2486360 RepID=UPI0021A1011C|nr:hypothetical protein EDD37DRAFT_605257 [Exophiala viscosa]
MSPDKHKTDTKGGGKDRKTGTALHKIIPGLQPCAKKHLRWGPLTYKPAPGSPGSTVTIPVAKSKPEASTHTSPNMLQLGEVQYVGHSSKYYAPTTYPQQMNPWPPHSSLTHGQWPGQSMQGGVMRIMGGDMMTSFRGVETMMRPEDFLKLSDQDRRALVTAGYAQYNTSNIPPPPAPMQIPSPPPPAKSAVAKTRAPTKAPSITPSESISSAPDRKERQKKKCVLCRQAERMPDFDEAKLCSGCYHYHGYLMAESKERKRTK